ncbi:MAG: hypothetical protein LBS19_11585, partial [Clostridiales bacterium]|nr:hypothetical protein [Clostridiales bacterium]
MNNEEKILEILIQMQAEQVKTNQRLDGLEQGQSKLEQGQAETNRRLESLEAGQAETNCRLESLEHGQAKIEVEHGDKLGALLDGYKLL